MPHFLLRLDPVRPDMHATGPTQQEAEAIGAHLGYLQRLMEQGALLLAGRSQILDQEAFALVLLQADSESQALALMRADPAVTQGVLSGELHPFRITQWRAERPELG
jgi:uncharacterized protein YciI